ncbi:MAG TPA: c-type cytochrome [Planctomycetaceae bacterium]|nr:c-type cytochrome [Planctomycetaceae bacterium]
MSVRFSVVALVTVAVVGCGKLPEPSFVLNEPTKELTPKARDAVAGALKDHFGTPNQLVAWEKLPLDYGKKGGVDAIVAVGGAPTKSKFQAVVAKPSKDLSLKGLLLLWTSGANEGKSFEIKDYADGYVQLKNPCDNAVASGDKFTVLVNEPGWRLKEGRNLYMRHCLHCHGVSGDGAGPTADYLNPRPRDYRLGIFKFTSTTSTSKASHEDIMRTLREGVPGTSMPSFVVILNPEEVSIVADYVRWLAMRGEFEKRLTSELAADYSKKAVAERQKNGEKEADIQKALDEYLGKAGAESEFATTIEDVGGLLAGDWKSANEPDSIVTPKSKRIEPSPESIAKGRALFMSEKAKCYSCHGDGGKGDGVSTVDYWAIPNTNPERKYPERGLHDAWGFSQKPRNLTLGVYRGGRRPIDIYRRVFAGIKGTQMAAFGGTVFNDEEMWHVVNYVLDVPYENQTLSPLHPPAPVQAKQ